MKHLNESILSKKTGIYDVKLSPNRSDIIEWLKTKKFIEEDRIRYIGTPTLHTLEKERRNIFYCGPANGRKNSDWVSIHTPKIYELVMWFDDDGKVMEIEMRENRIKWYKITFDDAKEMLLKNI